MKRFIFSILLVTLVGLAVVYGEIEAMKTGYRIRQLNMKKIWLVRNQKRLEFEVASLKTPHRLEQWIASQKVELVPSKPLRLARNRPEVGSPAPTQKTRREPIRFAKYLLGTAQAGFEP